MEPAFIVFLVVVGIALSPLIIVGGAIALPTMIALEGLKTGEPLLLLGAAVLLVVEVIVLFFVGGFLQEKFSR